MDRPLDCKMHTLTTKFSHHIFHVVQSSTEAKLLALLLKGPETRGLLRIPHPHSLSPKSCPWTPTQKVKSERHFLRKRCEGNIFCPICAGHLCNWALFILFILSGLFVCLFAQDRTMVLLFKATSRRAQDTEAEADQVGPAALWLVAL